MTGGTSVLIVEDDPKILRVCSASLEAEGYRVVDAANGQQAIEQVCTQNPDVILLDLGLPDIDGLALVPTMRSHTATPIIVVSAREQDADKVKALDAGANDYLTKPFSIPELLARVRVALRSRAQIGSMPRTIISFGDYRLDLLGRRLLRQDHAPQGGLGISASEQEGIRSRLYAFIAAKTRDRPDATSLPDQRGRARVSALHLGIGGSDSR